MFEEPIKSYKIDDVVIAQYQYTSFQDGLYDCLVKGVIVEADVESDSYVVKFEEEEIEREKLSTSRSSFSAERLCLFSTVVYYEPLITPKSSIFDDNNHLVNKQFYFSPGIR